MEWSEKNKYTSFNSMKGLAYYEHYKKILVWMDGKGELPPPIECNLDPIAMCNLNCYFCITQRYLKDAPLTGSRILPTDYMYELVDFLADWGVKGLCISGGGEPLLHTGVPNVLEYAQGKNMRTSIFTNGTIMSDKILRVLSNCQFVSLSINAANSRTYKEIMGIDLWDSVDANIHLLGKQKGGFKCVRMLILPENYKQIHKVCKWAKEIGLDGFNVRPVDFEREDIEGHKKLVLPIDFIREEFAKCHAEETDNFKVFTVTHKFDDSFHVKHDFKQCLATPLLIPILQDSNAYVCVDKKMELAYKLGSCYLPENILQWWGSDEHREAIKRVNINSCSRCTFSEYQRQIVEVVQEDRMFLSFP